MLNRKMLKVGETTDRILLFSKLSQETNHHHHCRYCQATVFWKNVLGHYIGRVVQTGQYRLNAIQFMLYRPHGLYKF